MNYKKIGPNNELISTIGLGCMGMSHAYSGQDEKSSIETLNRALELGINFWDTADIYGNGTNEELISKVLKHNRDKIFIATKFGFRYQNSNSFATDIDCSPTWIKQAVELSLKRLKIECIDLYYMHRADPNIPIEDTVGTMKDLVQQGKIKYIGLSEVSLTTLKKANAVHPITAVQSEYSLLTRELEKDILPFLKEKNILLVAFSPLGRGMFTENFDLSKLESDDLRLRLPRFQGEHLINNLKLTQELNKFAQSKNINMAQLALAWILHKGGNIIPIAGTKTKKYLELNSLAIQVDLSLQDIKTIENIIIKYPNTGERYPESSMKLVNN